MTFLIAQTMDPNVITRLTDSELEEELTLASLTAARKATFEALLAERRRRRAEAREQRPSR